MDEMEADTIDSIVCDPPYGLAFMGKGWDHAVPGVEFWTAALRVAKPGAHLVAFGGTRTYHRLTCAIEDAGWEIRDCLSWLYGSGFPKSLDVSKAIDKAAGATREVVGSQPRKGRSGGILGAEVYIVHATSLPTTAAAREWSGWGTALKPAWEPIILARKPLRGTVAANVQKHGTGAINVDGCRIGMSEADRAIVDSRSGAGVSTEGWGHIGNRSPGEKFKSYPAGRWPANVILDEEAAGMVDEQSGESSSPEPGSFQREKTSRGMKGGGFGQKRASEREATALEKPGYADSGGASRFFYTAKASRSEREEGLFGAVRAAGSMNRGEAAGRCADNGKNTMGANDVRARNFHPTVKPVDLMSWLCRLVTRPGGTILDPFVGSGSTGVAAVAGGWNFIGCEIEPEYVQIARARIAATAPLLAKEITA